MECNAFVTEVSTASRLSKMCQWPFSVFFYFYLLFYSATRVISSHLHSNLGFVLLHSPLSESFSAWVTEGHPLMSSIVTMFVLP